MSKSFTAINRLVPPRSWREKQTLLALGCLLVAAAMIPLIVTALIIFGDLLIHRGRVERVTEDAWAAVLHNEGIIAQDYPDPSGDVGLWGTAWRYRSVPAWAWLQDLCGRFAWTRSTNIALLLTIAFIVACVFLFIVAFSQASSFCARAARGVTRGLRTSVYRQTLRLGPSDVTQKTYQSAERLFVDDIERIRESIFDWRLRCFRALTLLPMLVICLLAIDWRLALQCSIPAAVCWWFGRYERTSGARLRQLADARAETELRFLAEGLKNARLITGYHMEDFEQQLFSRHLDRMSSTTSEGRRTERLKMTTARLLSVAGIGIILLLIAMRVTSPIASIPLSMAVAIVLAIICLTIELASVERLYAVRAALETAGDRLLRYLDEIPQVSQAVGARFVEPVSKSIVLESVSYRRGPAEVIKGVELKLDSRQQIALVSTDPDVPRSIAYLLPRFIEPSSGRVLYDGQDIAWGTLESIRAETLYVGGEDVLLSGTVLDNILCGDTRYNKSDATEAAKAAHAHSFISRLPQGYETALGEHGEQLDAGQTFRIGLARAVLRNPAVMIIEEPAHPLDEDTKALIDDAYQRIALNRTVIYLPSRLTTIRRCDLVVFFHEGKVASLGSHSQLLKSNELYRHWDYITFNAFRRLNHSAT